MRTVSIIISTYSSPELGSTCHGARLRYVRSYYRRPDVVAAIWAFGLLCFYYTGTILTYYLLQNFYGYTSWDASVLQGTPQGVIQFCLFALVPATFYAILVRGLYMFHYRYVPQIDAYEVAVATPLLFSPSKLSALVVAFFGRNVRTSDTGKVYLIRIYLTLGVTIAVLTVASLHTVYSFIIPFIFRMEHASPLQLPSSYRCQRLLPIPRTSQPHALLGARQPLASLPPAHHDALCRLHAASR